MNGKVVRAAFIDRDGVINVDRNYVHKIRDFEFISGSIDGLRLLSRKGYLLIVITNQAGIAKGYYTVEDYQRLTDYMKDELQKHSVTLDGVFYCPHHPNGVVEEFSVTCKCRKPAAGMIEEAKMQFSIDLCSSVIIGDKASDIEAGVFAGIETRILVRSGHSISAADEYSATAVMSNLFEAAKFICR